MADDVGPSEAASTAQRALSALRVLAMIALGAVVEYIRQNGLPF